MNFRDAIEELDLRAWLEQYTEVLDGGGTEIRITTCPECGHAKGRLYVNTQKLLWTCYHCDWGRGLKDVSLLMASVSGRSPSSIRVELSRMVSPSPTGDMQERIDDLFRGPGVEMVGQEAPSVTLPGNTQFDGLSARVVRNYALSSRGLTDDDMSRLFLRQAGAVGITRKDGTEALFKGPWLVFPVLLGGRPVSWQARRVRGGDPKYVAPPNLKQWLWPLGAWFFEVYTDFVILVEGVFDAIAFLRHGYAALCTFGKTISDVQVNLLREMSPREVIFAWDLDAAKESIQSVKRVSFAFPNTCVAPLAPSPDGKVVDPGRTLTEPWGAEWLRQTLSNRFSTNSPEFFAWQMETM